MSQKPQTNNIAPTVNTAQGILRSRAPATKTQNPPPSQIALTVLYGRLIDTFVMSLVLLVVCGRF
jgi:hypothetical protein